MSEESQAMKDLVFWCGVFAILFIVFIGMLGFFSVNIIREVSAINQCSNVEDSKFNACYTAAK